MKTEAAGFRILGDGEQHSELLGRFLGADIQRLHVHEAHTERSQRFGGVDLDPDVFSGAAWIRAQV